MKEIVDSFCQQVEVVFSNTTSGAQLCTVDYKDGHWVDTSGKCSLTNSRVLDFSPDSNDQVCYLSPVTPLITFHAFFPWPAPKSVEKGSILVTVQISNDQWLYSDRPWDKSRNSDQLRNHIIPSPATVRDLGKTRPMTASWGIMRFVSWYRYC